MVGVEWPVGHDERVDLPSGLDAITGYTIIKAESMEKAVELAEAAPLITGMRVYELMPMGE